MPEHPGFNLQQINTRSMVWLRVRPNGADAAGIALQLPQQALQWRGGDPATHWLGPDQWLFISDSRQSSLCDAHAESTAAIRERIIRGTCSVP